MVLEDGGGDRGSFQRMEDGSRENKRMVFWQTQGWLQMIKVLLETGRSLRGWRIVLEEG